MVKREPLWSKEGPRPLKKEEIFGHVIIWHKAEILTIAQ